MLRLSNFVNRIVDVGLHDFSGRVETNAADDLEQLH